jgi:hypothetical protein
MAKSHDHHYLCVAFCFPSKNAACYVPCHPTPALAPSLQPEKQFPKTHAPNPNSNSKAQRTSPPICTCRLSQRMVYRVERLGGGGVELSKARSKSRIVCAIDLCASWTDWARCLNGGSSARKSSKRCCCSCAATAGSWSSRVKFSELLQVR